MHTHQCSQKDEKKKYLLITFLGDKESFTCAYAKFHKVVVVT